MGTIKRITPKTAFKGKSVSRADAFNIYDIENRPLRVNAIDKIKIDNKSGDSNWNKKRYRMDVLFRIRASYDEDGESFIFHYWINDLPINWNNYSRSRSMTMYYVAYLFNIDYPSLYIRSIEEDRIIVNEKMYIQPLRQTIYNDLRIESKSKTIKNLNDMG